MQSIQDIFTKVQNYNNNISYRFDIEDIKLYSNDFVNEMRRSSKFPWNRKYGSLFVFNDVINYPIFDDLEDICSPQDPYPQNDSNNFQETNQDSLAQNVNNFSKITTDYINGKKVIALRYNTGNHDITVDDFSDITKWILSGDASNLFLDNTYTRVGDNSLAFTITNNLGYSKLTNLSLNLDLSSFIDFGSSFLYLFLQAATSVNIKFGNNASNTWDVTINNNFDGSDFTLNWNLIGVSFYQSNKIGNPDKTLPVTYCEITINTTTSGLYRLNGFQFKNFKELTLPYYSKNFFKDSAGITKEYCTEADDILLGDNEYDDCCRTWNYMKVAAKKIKDADMITGSTAEYKNALKALRVNYPDLRANKSSMYIDPTPKASFSGNKLRQ